MQAMTRSLDDPIARQVAEYLLDRPQACDTAAGIRRWWLLEPVRSDELERALQTLCDIHVLGMLKSSSPGEPVRYALAINTTELLALLGNGDGTLPPLTN